MQPTKISRYRVSHMHSCGHVDDCHLQRTVAEGELCRRCAADKFNKEAVERASKPPEPSALIRLSRAIHIRRIDAAGLCW